MSEKESLELITSMIHKAKEACHSTGITAIMWGLVIVVCSLVRLSEIHFGYELPFDIYLLTILAVIPQIYFNIRENRSRTVKTWDELFMDGLWTGFGISIFLLVFIMFIVFRAWSGGVNQVEITDGFTGFRLYEYNAAFFLLLYGLPTFVTGRTMRFRPMLIGGLLCWVCCIVSLFTSIKIDLLLMALSAAGAWLVPGIIMEKEYQKAKKELVATDVQGS